MKFSMKYRSKRFIFIIGFFMVVMLLMININPIYSSILKVKDILEKSNNRGLPMRRNLLLSPRICLLETQGLSLGLNPFISYEPQAKCLPPNGWRSLLALFVRQSPHL